MKKHSLDRLTDTEVGNELLRAFPDSSLAAEAAARLRGRNADAERLRTLLARAKFDLEQAKQS